MPQAIQATQENTGPSGAVCTAHARTANKHDGTHFAHWLSFEILDRLVSTMDVQVIALSECVVGPGFVLELIELDAPSFHYIRDGHGNLCTPNESPVEIAPQTLIVVPPKCPFRFEPALPTPSGTGASAFMLSGIFRSLIDNSTDLFDTLDVPVVEQFSEDDALESGLQHALTELIARNACSDVLVSSAVKQVIVALIRRSLRTMNVWTRRLVVLSAAEHEFARAQGKFKPVG